MTIESLCRVTLSTIAVSAYLLLSHGLAGCGEVMERLDCRDICTDVEACVGDGFDVPECIDRCEDQPRSEIEECDMCQDSEGLDCGDCAAACAPLAI